MSLAWQQVRPDFSNSMASSEAASRGLSQAGDIFNKMQERQAAEKQREWANALALKQFDEGVRQFNENMSFKQDEAEEGKRRFGLTYALDKDKHGETVRHNKAMEAKQNFANRLALANFERQQKNDIAYNRAYNDLTTAMDPNTVDSANAQLMDAEAALNTMKANQKNGVPTDLEELKALEQSVAEARQHVKEVATLHNFLHSSAGNSRFWLSQRYAELGGNDSNFLAGTMSPLFKESDREITASLAKDRYSAELEQEQVRAQAKAREQEGKRLSDVEQIQKWFKTTNYTKGNNLLPGDIKKLTSYAEELKAKGIVRNASEAMSWLAQHNVISPDSWTLDFLEDETLDYRERVFNNAVKQYTGQ